MPRKINRRAPIYRLLVQRAAYLHVMRDIGYCHIQGPVAALVAMGKNCIVIILGVFPINGDKGHLSQVFAPDAIPLKDFTGEKIGFFFYRRWKYMRDIVTTHGHFNFQSGGTTIAQYFDDFGDGLATSTRILGNFGDDELTIFGIAGKFVGNQNFMGETFAVGYQNPESLLPIVAAYNLRVASLQDFDDGAFLTAAVVDAG